MVRLTGGDIYKERKGVWEMGIEKISMDKFPNNLKNAVDVLVTHLNGLNRSVFISKNDFQCRREDYQRDYEYIAELSIEKFELRSPKYPLATVLSISVIEDTFFLELSIPTQKKGITFRQSIRQFSGLDDSLEKLRTLLETLFYGELEERIAIIQEVEDKKKEEERIENEKIILKETIHSKSQHWAKANLSSLVDELNQIPNINLLENYTIKYAVQEALKDVILSKGSQEWYHRLASDSGMDLSSSFPSNGSVRSSSAARMLQALERLSLLG